MSFSLKYLFAIVAIAAIFTAGLIYRTPLWTFVAVNLGVVILLAASVGVWLKRLNRTFWLPFCVFGWFYFLSTLNVGSYSVLNRYSPSFQITELVRAYTERRLAEVEVIEGRAMRSFIEEELAFSIRYVTEVLNVGLALSVGCIAGVIASFLLRQGSEH